MGHNAPLPHPLQSIPLNQAQNGMIGATGLERTDFLIVLAFEEEVDFGAGCSSNNVAFGVGTGIRSGSEGGEGLACEQRGAVDVGGDQRVGEADVLGGQGEVGKGGDWWGGAG